MAKFIEVVIINDTEPIMVNTDHIVKVYAHYLNNKNYSRIVLSGNFPDLIVKQNYVQLFEELQN